nr:HEPN domain-containing protein [Azospirillum sp. INR13]
MPARSSAGGRVKDFADTLRAFEIASENLERIQQDASFWNDDPDALRRLDRLALVNQQAFFVLLFALFDAKLNTHSSALIKRMRSQTEWRDRRAWDLLDDKVRNMQLMQRVALLTDKGGDVYKRIKELYDIRNRIAHGTLLTEEIDVAEIAREIQLFAAGLNEAS